MKAILMINTFIFYAFLFSFSASQATEIYKCKINGRTVYTDTPCNGKKLRLKPINSTASNNALTKYNSLKWHYNIQGYKEALNISERFNAPIFIFFEADWCGYCRKLEKELLHTAGAKSALRPFVTVQITPEDGVAENHLFNALGGTGYPSIFIQKSKQSIPKKVRLQTQKNGEWRTQNLSEFKRLLATFLQ